MKKWERSKVFSITFISYTPYSPLCPDLWRWKCFIKLIILRELVGRVRCPVEYRWLKKKKHKAESRNGKSHRKDAITSILTVYSCEKRSVRRVVSPQGGLWTHVNQTNLLQTVVRQVRERRKGWGIKMRKGKSLGSLTKKMDSFAIEKL